MTAGGAATLLPAYDSMQQVRKKKWLGDFVFANLTRLFAAKAGELASAADVSFLMIVVLAWSRGEPKTIAPWLARNSGSRLTQGPRGTSAFHERDVS